MKGLLCSHITGSLFNKGVGLCTMAEPQPAQAQFNPWRFGVIKHGLHNV